MAPTGIGQQSLLSSDDKIKVKDIAKKHSEDIATKKQSTPRSNVPALVKLAAGNSTTTKTAPSTMVNITEDGDIVLKPATPLVSSTSTIQNYYIAKAQKDEFNKLLMRKTCSCSQPECKAILKQYYDDVTAPYPGYTKGSSSNKNKDVCKPVPKQLLIPIPNPSKMKQVMKRTMNTQIYNRAISALNIPNGESRSDIYVAIHHYPREVIERYQLTEIKGNTKFKDCLLPSSLVESLNGGSGNKEKYYSEEDKFNCLGTNAESSDCKKQNVCSCNVYINIPCLSVAQAKEQRGKKVNITPQDLLNEPEKAVIVAKVDGHGTKTYKGLPKKEEQIIDGVMMKSCRGCKGYKPKEQYKKREWDKKAGLERECKTCEDVDKMISNINKKQSPAKNLKTEKRKKITGDEWKNEKKTHQMFEVVVPGGVAPGQTFSLVADGQRVTLICPQTAKPGGKVRFQLPIPEEGSAAASSPKTKAQDTFEVVVPEGVKAGESFSLLADGQKVTLMCPEGKGGGDTVRFQLPMASAVYPETKQCKTCKESKPEAAFSKGNWNHSATGECKACVMKEINRIDQMSARQLRSKLVSLQDDTETWKSKYQKSITERNAARSLNYKLEQKLKKAERDVKALTNHLSKAVKKLGEDMPDLSGKKRSRDSTGGNDDDDGSSPKKRRHDLNADGSVRVRRRAKKNKDGTMTPASQPKLLEDGTYAKPGSKAPKGYAWCVETGLWVPESGLSGSVNVQPPYEEDV